MWNIQVKDKAGNPVPDIEMVVMDRRTGDLWNSTGNWDQGKSLFTNNDGEVAFALEQEYGFGGESVSILSYEKTDVPELAIGMRLRGRTIFFLPLSPSFCNFWK